MAQNPKKRQPLHRLTWMPVIPGRVRCSGHFFGNDSTPPDSERRAIERLPRRKTRPSKPEAADLFPCPVHGASLR
ncbi:MAG: hypothetical protein AAF914_15040 [Pseudomonadota bacterium]